MKTILYLAVAAFAWLAAGCAGSVSSRIQEKSQVFGSLSPAEQIKIREGQIDEGFTADMVYMALGKPSKIEGRKWIFRNHFPAGQSPYSSGGTQPGVGTVSDASNGLAPASGELDGVMAPIMEVMFSDGRVSAINIIP